MLSAFFKNSFLALGLQQRESFGALRNASPEFPPRARTIAGNDCWRLSAALQSQWPLQLSETFAGLYWSYLFGWTMTSVKWWRFWLRQHLREQGCNRGRGSPIKGLVGFTLNRYKNISRFRHLPVRTLNQKTKKKNASLTVCFYIFKYNLYCAVKHRKLNSLSRLWHFRGNFILTWQNAYGDF